MKKLLSILFLMLGLSVVCRGQQIITATITVTNVNGTANGQTLTINGLTRTWTNVFTVALTQILTAANNYQAGTNLFNSYIISPFANTSLHFNGSNGISLQTFPGGAMGVSLSSGWGNVSFVTNTIGTTVYQFRAPFSVATPVEKTNIETALPNYLNDNLGSTVVNTSSPPFSLWWTWINSISSQAASGSTNSWSLNGNTASAGNVLGTMNAIALSLVADGHSMLVFDGTQNRYTFGTNSPNLGQSYDGILQGNSNLLSGVINSYSTTVNGLFNTNIALSYGFIGTGIGNSLLSYPYETIINGSYNTDHGNWSTIENGSSNTIGGPNTSAAYSTILNGSGNTITSSADLRYGTILNGQSNLINAAFGVASGVNCDIENDSVWMWADNQPTTFTSAFSNTFLIRAQNGVGINTASTKPYGLNVGGSVNAQAYYLNGQPLVVGSGGGGGSGTNITLGGSVGTLYNVSLSPGTLIIGYTITNLVITGVTGSYSYLNGTYYPQSPYGQFNLNYAGNSYNGWYSYTNSFGQFIFGGVITTNTFYCPNCWNLFSGILPSGTSFDTSLNNNFNLLDPNFNNTWLYNDFYHQVIPTVTPTLVTIGTITNYTASSTIAWNFGDNWNFNLTGVTNATLSLAQDWKATNASQVESHKIFITSATNTCLLSFGSTNLWKWQNRQGLLAYAPASVSSNETITITLNHRGTYTNWLATWETSLPTNGVSGLATNGFTVTNWTTLSSPTTTFTTNVLYTCTNGPAIFFGNAFTPGGQTDLYIYYTNNGVGYFTSELVYNGLAQTEFSFPLNTGSTFEFQLLNNGVTAIVTNAQIWQLPH